MNNENVAKQEFTFSEGICYMMGAIGIQIVSVIIVQFASFYYTPPSSSHRIAYITITMSTIMMMFGRIIDAFVDPYIGFWSDKTKSKWGRRRPFIIFGTFPLALVFILFWFPPVPGVSVANFIYSTFFMTAFWFFFAIVLIPYFALLPEIAKTTQGRINLGVFQSIGMNLGLFVAFTSGMLIDKIGYKAMSVIYAVIAIICFEIMAFGVKERYHEEEHQSDSHHQVNFLNQLKTALQNKPFMIFMIAVFLFNLGFYVIQVTLPYFVTVVVKGTEADLTKYLLGFTLIAIPVYPLLIYMSKKIAVKNLFAGSLLMMTAIFPFLYVMGVYKGHISKDILAWILITLAGIPQVAIYVLQGTIFGETVDYDEKQTGKRREALYMGVQGFATKLGMTFSYGIMWLLFKPFGFSTDRPMGILLVGPVTALISFIGFLVFMRYPKNLSKQ